MIRERWPDNTRFIMAAIGAAVGGGCFTAFPPAALAHGGAAFLIPCMVAIATVAGPLLALELGVGLCFQGAAPESLRKVHRRAEWLGWWSTVVCAVLALAGAAAMAWFALYAWDAALALFGNRPLPWGTSVESARAHFQHTFPDADQQRAADALAGLHPSGSALLLLALVWLLLHAGLVNGFARIGNWTMITFPLAVVLLVVLGVANLSQDGAVDGVATYLSPQWGELLRLDTWLAAYGVVIPSLSLGLGVFTAYASYLNRNADVTGVAIITVLAGSGYAFLAGFVVSSAAGVLAAASRLPVSEVPLDALATAFVSYPAALANFAFPHWVQALLALVLFTTLFALTLDTVLGLLVAVLSALADRLHREWSDLVAWTCVLGFLASALFCTNTGPRLAETLGDLLTPFGLALAAAGQCLALVWTTGADGVHRHLNAYSVVPVGRTWRFMIAAATPLALLALAVQRAVQMTDSAPAADQPGWLLTGAALTTCVLAVLAAWSLTVGPRRLP